MWIDSDLLICTLFRASTEPPPCPFFMAIEQEFPHNDMLAKLAGLGSTFNFFHINLFLHQWKITPSSITSKGKTGPSFGKTK